MKLFDQELIDRLEEANKNPNRYAQIHILFREIAHEKLGRSKNNVTRSMISDKTAEVKSYWKNFFNVKSLTQLDDIQLSSLTRIIMKRLETVKKIKRLK